MTFRELTELQEQSPNAAHRSAIMHRVETSGWNQLDHSRREIAAGDGLRPEMVNKRWSRPEVDRGLIRMATG